MKEMKNSKRNVSRRDFLRLGGLSAGAAVLAACGGGGGGAEEAAEETAPEETAAEETTSEEAAPAAEAKEIVWWFGWANLEPAIETINGLESFQDHIAGNRLTWLADIDERVAKIGRWGNHSDGGTNIRGQVLKLCQHTSLVSHLTLSFFSKQ